VTSEWVITQATGGLLKETLRPTSRRFGARAFSLTQGLHHEKGITLEGHWSKGLRDVPMSEMDVVVEMGHGVKCPVPADFKGRLIRWDISDPYGQDQDYFRDVRDMIESEVEGLLAELIRDSPH
jgi:protein-tyrosine-phosphatase